MRPSSAIIAATLWFPGLAAASGCSPDPAKSAVEFYEHHQNFIHAGASSPPLSEELARAVKNNIDHALTKGEVGAIDWNFWTSAQDGDQSRTARVYRVAQKRSKAEVVLAYTFDLGGTLRPSQMRAVVHLNRSPDGCWLVADVTRGQSSVAKLLRASRPGQTPR